MHKLNLQDEPSFWANRGLKPPFHVFHPRTDDRCGYVMLVHGGSWHFVGVEQTLDMELAAGRWRNRGWGTLNIDYRPLADCLEDVLAFIAHLRECVGSDIPIGLYGSSAGGHLALLVAALRDDIAFVVCEGAPTDLVHLGGTPEADEVRGHAVRTFGERALATMSPARRAHEIQCPIVLATCISDDVVPVSQMQYMQEAAADRTEVFELAAGDEPFVHATVAHAGLEEFIAAEQRVAAACESTVPAN